MTTQPAGNEPQIEDQMHGESLGPAATVVDTEPAAPPSGQVEHYQFEQHAWLLRAPDHPRRIALKDIPQLITDNKNLVWVDFSAYTREDLNALAKLLKLPQHSVELAAGEWQRPQLDVFEDIFVTLVTIAELEPEVHRVRAHQLELFAGNNFLVSAHKQPLPFAAQVLTRASSNRDLAHYDSTLMLYLVLDELVGHYELQMERVQDEIELMEERALTDTSDDFLNDLFTFKRYVFAFSRLAQQHRNTFAAYLRAEFPFMNNEQMRGQYHALLERLDRLINNLESTKNSVNGTFDIYVSHVSHRTNNVMKLLTIVSTIVLPVSLIFAFYGTSFEGLSIYEPRDFWLMIGLSLACSIGALVYFRRNKWL